MADRLANYSGQPFNPNKELWGQGCVLVVAPLVNGFPHTGALARTATNIKLGAISPLAGIFKCVPKLPLAAFLASCLELVPMACIGGILIYVAFNMVKKQEVQEVLRHNKFHIGLMAFTAIMVIVTDFLTGVLFALTLYSILARYLVSPAAHPEPSLPNIDELAESLGQTAAQSDQLVETKSPIRNQCLNHAQMVQKFCANSFRTNVQISGTFRHNYLSDNELMLKA